MQILQHPIAGTCIELTTINIFDLCESDECRENFKQHFVNDNDLLHIVYCYFSALTNHGISVILHDIDALPGQSVTIYYSILWPNVHLTSLSFTYRR